MMKYQISAGIQKPATISGSIVSSPKPTLSGSRPSASTSELR